jgi:hypothetical protein
VILGIKNTCYEKGDAPPISPPVTTPDDAHALTAPVATPLIPFLLNEEIEAARTYAAASRASSTRRAYASDWRIFTAWCAARQIEPLPADPRAVAVFLAAEAEAGSKPATIGRRLAAIGHHHRTAGFEPPQAQAGAHAIRDVLAGIRRTKGVKPTRKQAADGDAMRDILRAITGDTPRAVRDRALLAIGMAAALRRSEIVALQLDDVALVGPGATPRAVVPPAAAHLFIEARQNMATRSPASLARHRRRSGDHRPLSRPACRVHRAGGYLFAVV